ncbi:NADH-quinone oxidoreductase subunit J, partial [Candidatus Liberibacter sp.]|uniref:NADH-quinone oxidoreductase subunit J n=1 Tax=Candidatus Liberibacter sp. TaxID=34022 RepID=UPI0015F59ABB
EARPYLIKRGFLGAFFIGVLAIELIIGVSGFVVLKTENRKDILNFRDNNTEYLGKVLYTVYAYHLEIAGFILLVSMIGSIVLILRHRRNIKRQDVSKQLKRHPDNSVEIVKVKSGHGV